MSLVENLFSGNGLYILDEPESALSPMILMTLMCHLKNWLIKILNLSSLLIPYPIDFSRS